MTRDTDERPGSTDATVTTGPTEDEPDANSMGDVDHTHPHGNTTFGSIFGRGPTVAADGGAPAVAQDDTSMREVSHESPTGTDPNAAFERGAGVDDGQSGVRTDE